MRHFVKVNRTLVAMALAASAPLCAYAQKENSKLKVIGVDSVPIPFVLVTVDGDTPLITDERGELSLGNMHDKTVSLEVRRIGYKAVVGTFEFPDTATVMDVILWRIAQNLQPVVVAGARAKSSLELAGFYSRWLHKQLKGPQGSTFIGPETIDQRKPAVTTDLLSKVLGVTLQTDTRGVRVPMGTGLLPTVGSTFSRVAPASSNDRGACYMTVMVDGRTVCPNVGCHYVFPSEPAGSRADDHSVDIDKLVAAQDIAGIEVYPHRDGMPDYAMKVYEGCGVVSIWTKQRQ